MNVLRKISIDTVLLWLAVALCIAGLVWLGGAHAWITALGVGVFVAAQEAPEATNPPRSCATCSRPLDAWQLRFDGGAELRCGRYDCAAKDKLVATREVQADGTVRETEKALEIPSQDPPRAEAETAANRARDADAPNRLNKTAYSGLVAEDIAWLEAQPRTLERDHVIMIVRASAGREYPARSPLDLAALRTLSRETRDHDAAFRSTDAYSIEEAVAFLNQAVADRIALASAVEQLADALEAKTPPRARLDTDELAIIERTRALVRALDELRASVDLLDEQGRKMKAERDAALLEVAALKLAHGASRSAFADGEAHERRKRDVTIERLQGELDTVRGRDAVALQELRDALAQIERMKPVVDLVGEWCQVADGTPEEDAIETRIIDAFGEYQEAGAL